MPRLIDANILETAFTNAKRSCKTDLLKSIYSVALKAVNDCPTVDAVSIGVHDQVRWERDVAIEQLESYGVSLGEKADVVKVVHGRWDEIEEEVWHLCQRRTMPRFVCSRCERMENKKSDYCPNCGAKMDGDGNG